MGLSPFFSIFALWLIVFFCFTGPLGAASEVTIGSKKFTESVILGEILYHLTADAGAQPVHRRELGGTRILWNALLKGDIDAYAEYSGTISQEILAAEGVRGLPAIRAALKKRGILMSLPLGFNNTYIIGMKKERAAELNIEKISDLRFHPGLRLGFSNEFIDRGDGWPGLRNRYNLPQTDVRGLDHDIAYRGLEEGAIDAIDLYSTDAEIRYYGLRRLKDDLNYFPEYKALILYREELKKRCPLVVKNFLLLEGKITEEQMTLLNARSKLDKMPESRAAAEFLSDTFSMSAQSEEETGCDRFLKHTREHLLLVFISLAAAIIVSLPLGIAAAKFPKAGHIILGIVGIIQTIPSLALLVFMIPLLGIGGPPALMALFLYSLLPIVRNTYTGIHNIPVPIRESAQALGLPARARLFLIELPLASRTILAGIKTSAVINVGTATLGALIGAGGYGQPILTGIRLDDVGLILQGAVPAALLALLVQLIFDIFDRVFIPRGLRIKSGDS
ncbi:MAG: ABC transporter permease subunit [Candidatus Aminicenantes bacterium]|nr:ABC transporter permease subunit [Candidatus Aminicenantes bacterium]